MHVLGRSLLGGALAAGIITAAGIAVAGATAVAYHQAQKESSGAAVAEAHISVTALRDAFAVPAPADARASAAGSPIGNLNAWPEEGACESSASGAARVDFNAYGDAQADASVSALAYRYTRARRSVGYARAYGEGDGQTYVVPDCVPAVGKATGFGTTYHLGAGQATAKAVLTCAPEKHAGGKGHALATAEGIADAEYTAGFRGVATLTAYGMGDAIVTRAGIEYHEANGHAVAEAEAAPATTVVFQPQKLSATATAEAIPVHQRGAKGLGVAKATATADALLSSTGAAAAAVFTQAEATGRCVYLAGGIGHAQAGASGVADATVVQTRAEAAEARATVTAEPAHAPAERGAAGVAQAEAAGQNIWVTRTHYGRATAVAKAELVSGAAHFEVSGQPASAGATASALALRTTLVYGEAVAAATGRGANQINDILRAPIARTLTVAPLVRVVPVAAQPRTIAA